MKYKQLIDLLVSSGWYDPFSDGARVFTIGAYLNRTDRTNFFVGYRFIDPIDSRALTTATTYVFSPKYAITASSTPTRDSVPSGSAWHTPIPTRGASTLFAITVATSTRIFRSGARIC